MSRINLLFMFTFYTSFAAREPPTVTLEKQGTIIGKEVSRSRVHKIIGYFGIPYAKPPLGEYRFAPPESDELPTWEDVRNATEYQPACLQNIEDIREEDKAFLNLINPDFVNLTTSEDCLYLNVFVPNVKPPKLGFTTIIWFHPGNFATGYPSMWNPHTLVHRHNIIVVTFAWRVGFLGFFSTLDEKAPGNYGMFDQQAALMWVNNNIKAFGGNSSNICLMGYGTGGVSVGLHMMSQHSKQFFNKAIIMSANLLSPSVVKNPEEEKSMLDSVLEKIHCRINNSDFMTCMRNADSRSMTERVKNIDWKPLIDDKLSNTAAFLQELPKNYFERTEFDKLPLLTGYTNMGDTLRMKDTLEEISTNSTNEDLRRIVTTIISEDISRNNMIECDSNRDYITDAVMFFYGLSSNTKDAEDIRKIISDLTTDKNYAASTFRLANSFSMKQPTFVYRFDMKPSTPWIFENIPEWVSVPHLYDLIYVWGMPYWVELAGKNWETRDRRFSDIIMSFWTNFAKSSDPTKILLYPIGWDQFTLDNPNLLIIDGFFNMSNSKTLNYKAIEFWNDHFPKVLNIAKTCCNARNDAIFSLGPSYFLLFTIQFLLLL